MCDFPKIRAPYFGVLIVRVRILLFRVAYYIGSPIFGNPCISVTFRTGAGALDFDV